MTADQSHCYSSGAGRTGTYIAFDSLLDQAKEENVINVFEHVKQMEMRRTEIIQTLVKKKNLKILLVTSMFNLLYIKYLE